MAKKNTHKQIQISNEEVHKGLRPLQELARKEFPTKIAYDISRTLTNVESEVQKVQEFRTSLVKKYAVLDDNGEVKFAVDPQTGKPFEQNGQKTGQPQWADQEAFDKEVDELAQATADFKAFRVPLEDLGPTIRATSLMALEWFIIVDDDEEAEAAEAATEETPVEAPAKKKAA
jgi:hypothetical protein